MTSDNTRLDIKIAFPKRANGALTREYADLTFKNLTRGDMACIVNALAERAAGGSSMAHDLFMIVRDRTVDNEIWPEVAGMCHTDAEIAEARRGDVPAEDPRHPRISPGKYEFPNTVEGGDFSGLHAAQQFLTDHNYSFGHMQADAPIGLVYGAADIQKWRNLGEAECALLDGVIKPFVVGFRNIEPSEGDKERGATQTVYGGAIVTIYGPEDTKEGCRPPKARK